MSLPIPGVGTESGPQYATDINNCLTIIDQHNHTPGYGEQIPTAGININTDLSFNNFNATYLRSTVFQIQASPLSGASDLACAYVSGVDLYYNDANGNQVRLTQNGNVAGTAGSIANLTSPASASYVSLNKTFVWQSDANTPANMDNAAITLRNVVANSKGLTLSPPNAMAADYSIVLPSLPVSQKIVTLDASGNMTAPWSFDNSTIAVNTNVVGVPDGGITYPKMSTVNMVISPSSGIFTEGSTSVVDVPGVSCTITTSGHPVQLCLISDGTPLVSGSPNACFELIGSGAQAYIIFAKDGVAIGSYNYQLTGTTSIFPASVFSMIDTPAAGTYTYKLQIKPDAGSSSMTVVYLKLVAYEIR